MTDLYLIAHKVRGEPAFDVASRIECPLCPEGIDEGFCHECDNTGYWWIIPTSGHRAYPWWFCEMWKLGYSNSVVTKDLVPPMPSSLPDHYLHKAAPTISLIEALGLSKPAAKLPPMVRRL